MKNSQEEVNNLLNKTPCEYNEQTLKDKKKPSCKKPPQPGAAQGNCPFEGAIVALGPITDAAHLVHGPVSCTRNPWGSKLENPLLGIKKLAI